MMLSADIIYNNIFRNTLL